MGQAPPKRKSAAARKPKRPAEHGNEGGQSATRRKHFAEIVRPDLLWRWVMEKNPTLRHFQQALQDWGKRRPNPSRRPLCLTCEHAFHPKGSVPPAWLFVRVSVNKAGVPRQMMLVGICEKCAAKDCDPAAGGLCRPSQGVPANAGVQDAGGSGRVERGQLNRNHRFRFGHPKRPEGDLIG